MTRLPWLIQNTLLAAALLAHPACSDDEEGGGSGVAGEDTGGGDRADAGPGDEDSGPPSEDTGPSNEDTGPPAEDTGPADEDTGPADEDTGPPAEDTGPPAEDVGVEGSPLCGPCERSADCAGFQICADGDDGERFCTDECGGPFNCSVDTFTCRGDGLCYPPGGTCTNPCTGVECPDGEFCNLSSGECSSPLESLCEECRRDAECGGPDDLCSRELPEGPVCGMWCGDDDLRCPEGFVCLHLDDHPHPQGEPNHQCVPDSGVCDNPCEGKDCDEGLICQPASGNRCLPEDQALCASPCNPALDGMCGHEKDLCISYSGQPWFCGRRCSDTICEVDEDCEDEGLVCDVSRNGDPELEPGESGQCGAACPGGFGCANVVDGQGNVVTRQCAPRVRYCDDHRLGITCGGLIEEETCGGPNTVCTDIFDGGVCTQDCVRDNTCPEDWKRCVENVEGDLMCFPQPAFGPDACGLADRLTGGAIPLDGGAGAPCRGAEGQCLEGLTCIISAFPTGGARGFCAGPCASNDDCAEGQSCMETAGAGLRCVPAECACVATTDEDTVDLFRPLGRNNDGAGTASACDFAYREDDLIGVQHFNRHDRFLMDRSNPRHRNPIFGASDLGARVRRLDAAVAGDTPLGDALREAALEIDRTVPATDVPEAEGDAPLVAAITAMWAAVGEAPEAEDLVGVAEVPAEVQEAVAPILLAIAEAAEGVERSLLALEDDPLERDPATLRRTLWQLSASSWLRTARALPLALSQGDAGNLLDDDFGTDDMLLAGAAVADALDATAWDTVTGLEGVALNVVTPLGRVILADAEDHQHDPERLGYDGPIAFLLDTGGDDTWRVAAGANAGPDHPVSVAVDLGGNDAYAYAIVDDPNDDDELLPSDVDGRFAPEGGLWNRDGAASRSEVPRQGAGRLGVGILVDLGATADTYSSLRMSQGFGALGVGILYDDGGDDSYTAEAGSQGSAGFGVGLLIDAEGDDDYRLWTRGQGFGAPRGAGVLYDRAGDDSYEAVAGEEGEASLLYHSTEDPGASNRSLAQGAGAGICRALDAPDLADARYDHYNCAFIGPVSRAAGGVGILRDHSGSDEYLAGARAQGAGDYQGTGLLADGAGDDRYNGRAYVQATASRYGSGFLLEGSGNDSHNADSDVFGYSMGAAHQFGTAVLIDESGDDSRFGDEWALGAATWNGLALFVDNRGRDTYDTLGDTTMGAAEAERQNDSFRLSGEHRFARTYGYFIDAGGDDVYVRDDLDPPGPDTPEIANDSTWDQSLSAQPPFWERGRGVDGCGDSFAHTESSDDEAPYGVWEECPPPPDPPDPGEGEGEGEGEEDEGDGED